MKDNKDNKDNKEEQLAALNGFKFELTIFGTPEYFLEREEAFKKSVASSATIGLELLHEAYRIAFVRSKATLNSLPAAKEFEIETRVYNSLGLIKEGKANDLFSVLNNRMGSNNSAVRQKLEKLLTEKGSSSLVSEMPSF